MLISQTAEYALRAMVFLGNAGDARTTQQIADETQVPAGYLSKVLQSLRRSGLVQARRGLYGGFTLARPAEEITTLQVVNAVDPLQRILECPLGLPEHRDKLCALHSHLDDATEQVESAFDSTTLASLLSK